MKHLFRIAIFLVLTAMLIGCTEKEATIAPESLAAPPVTTGILADHPDMTEQEMYIPCSECHREETPEIVDQWWYSGHGIGIVKCYQCHGTYEGMMRVPPESACMVCHEEQMKKLDDSMTCWHCHPAHGFTGHQTERGE